MKLTSYLAEKLRNSESQSEPKSYQAENYLVDAGMKRVKVLSI